MLDVGFTDAIAWTPDTIETSGLLAFAGIEPIEIPAVPIRVHLAEKIHAYTRTYGEGERASTRPKDLVDILLISAAEPVDAGELREALDRTFSGRGRQRLPAELPAPPEGWPDKYGRLAREVAVEPDLGRAFELAAGFVDPVLAGEAAGRWDPSSWEWR